MKPAGCPRDRDGGLGPRPCGYLAECRYHNLYASRQRRPPAPERVTAAIELLDDCSLDAAERTELEIGARGPRRVMSLRRIGMRLGISRQRVAIIADLALQKYAEGMGLKASPGVLADLLLRRRRR